MTPPNETFTILTTFPGVLVYHLLVLSTLLLALISVCKAYKSMHAQKIQRVMLGLIIVLVLQLLLLAFSIPAWFGSATFSTILPIVFRFLSLAAFVWLVWMLLSEKPKTWQTVAAGSVNALLLCLAGLTLFFWLRQSGDGVFNGSWLDHLWQIFAMLICISALILVIVRRNGFKLEPVLIICLALAGHLLHLLLPNWGNLPAMVIFSQLLLYSLLPGAVWHFINLGFVNSQNGILKTAPNKQDLKVDVTPRLASAMLDISLQNSDKKIHNAVSHAVSLFMMADICAILHLDSQNKEIRFESTYDLIREDYLKNFALTEAQVPMLFQSFQDGKILQLDKKDHSQDLQSLFQAIGYNQLGNPVFFPIKYNGKACTTAFLFLTPYTFHQWQSDSFEKLEVLSPNLVKILDNAVEIDARNAALDAVRVSLNQSVRENQKLQQQYERSQQLLAELRSEFNNSKASHLSEIQIWIERQKQLEDKIQSLETQVADSINEVNAARAVQAQKQALEKQLEQVNAQNARLHSALNQAKSVLEGILSAQDRDNEQVHDAADQQGYGKSAPANAPAAPESHPGFNPLFCLHDVSQGLSEAFAQKNVKLATNLQNCPEDVSVDPNAFKLILRGLLTNALKASPNGGQVNLTLQLEQFEGTQVGLVIEATDQGGGLSLQEQDSFFTLIERIGQPIPGGVGDVQSLRDVLRLVRHVNGNIWIKSDVDKPTTYRVTIPAIQPIDDAKKEELPK
jgi:signal transduction histidine kinase